MADTNLGVLELVAGSRVHALIHNPTTEGIDEG